MCRSRAPSVPARPVVDHTVALRDGRTAAPPSVALRAGFVGDAVTPGPGPVESPDHRAGRAYAPMPGDAPLEPADAPGDAWMGRRTSGHRRHQIHSSKHKVTSQDLPPRW
jgi:hypothetical protein